jgi:peptide/nickel transport system ATP-binding protein
MIAIAMCCHPKLLIADEPTTALDVTIQAQILKLMKQLRDQEGTSVLLITHDLGVVANMCDRVAVMYCGKVVEQGTTHELLSNPKHPYTQGLINSIPMISDEEKTLYNIPGTVPKIMKGAVGCSFADRCEHCTEICRTTAAPTVTLNGQHTVRCHHV